MNVHNVNVHGKHFFSMTFAHATSGWFYMPTAHPACLIFMILTPFGGQDSQIQILAQISRIFSNETAKRLALEANDHIRFISAVKPASAGTAP